MLTDIRLAARLLWKDRGLTLAAVAALGLGIAANATVFSLFNGIFLRTLPFDAPDRMVVLNARIESNPDTNFPVSYLELLDWRAGARTFDGLAGFTDATMNLAGDDDQPERLSGAYVSAETFALTGQRPALGRPFRAEDDRPGAAPVVMLSDAVWRRRYAGDPAIVGRQLRVNGVAATVIGVMPAGFGFPNNAAVWQTLAMLPDETRARRDNRSLLVLGRMAPGVTLAQALADVTAVAASLPGRSSAPGQNVVPKLRTFREFFTGPDLRTGFALLLAAVGFVLLIACANVANLLLARGARRSREITVRMSLGASRGRIVRQLLLECALLSAAATSAGAALSLAGVRLFENAIAGTGAPYWFDFGSDVRVFAFLALVGVGAVALFGLLPALQTTRTNLLAVLSHGARGSSGAGSQRWAGGLVVGQLALTLTLLMSAGLVIRDLVELRAMPIGLATGGVTVMTVDLGRPQTAGGDDATRRFYRALDERLAALSDLLATYATSAPLGGASERHLGIADLDTAGNTPRRQISHLAVGPRYFEVLGVHVRQGRAFDAPDRGRAAIINQRLADLYFPDQDPIGQRVRLEPFRDVIAASDWLTVVGVVPNVRQRSTGSREFDPVLYEPYGISPLGFATFVVRSPLDVGVVASRIRAELRAVDPDLPLFDVRTLDAAIAFERWSTRLFGTMFGAFAGMALLLAAIGLYGVTAYAVSQRTREIGIRAALGAQSRQIWWAVGRRATVQVALGVVLGTAGALGMGRLLQSLLQAVNGTDPLTLAAVCGLLVLVTAGACAVPARRAMRINPVDALRAE